MCQCPTPRPYPSCWHTSSSFFELARTLGALCGSPMTQRSGGRRSSQRVTLSVLQGWPVSGRVGQRCDLCLSLYAGTHLVSDPDPDHSSRLKALEAAVLAVGSVPPTTLGQGKHALVSMSDGATCPAAATATCVASAVALSQRCSAAIGSLGPDRESTSLGRLANTARISHSH